jgi:MFS family permease
MVNFLALIPLVPLSLWAGSFIDRHSKQKIILVTQAIMMAQALILAVLSWQGLVQGWHVYVLAFILGSVNAVDVPARQSFTVDMVEGKEDLTNAIGLNSTMFNMARALGPAMAGLVVAATGEGTAFFINSLTFLAVMGSLAMMRDLPQSSQVNQTTGSGWGHISEGLRFISRQKAIFFLISLIAVSAFLSNPYTTLMPVFATDVLGKSAQPVIEYFCHSGAVRFECEAPEALPLGILLTMVGIGAVAGALMVASLPERANRTTLLTMGNIGFPLLLLLFSSSRSFIASALLLILVGMMFVIQNSLANTLLQIATPDHLRGRVMSVYTMITQGMMRMGGLQAGLVADFVSPQFSVGAGALISLAYGLFVALRIPEVRKLK